MPKHYILKAEPGVYKLTGQDTKLVLRAVKKNWRMISIYAAVTLGGIVASYYTNGWLSVGISSVVAAITFFVGLRMLQQVVIER